MNQDRSAYATHTGYLGGGGAPVAPQHARLNHLLLTLIPWTAIACIVVVYVAEIGALIGMRRLHGLARPATPLEFMLVGRNPPVTFMGLFASMAVPAIFLVTWLLLLFH